jgi:hypothetical protein
MNSMHKHPRSSKIQSDKPRLLNPSYEERNWIRTIPDNYPDILRAPAVSYKPERDDKRIQANRYLAYARPYRGNQGLLIIGNEFRPVIIDESHTDRPNVLPMRLDRESLQDTWIFAITIFHSEGLIQIEDCIVSAGEQIRSTKPFNERFAFVHKFADHIWFQDVRFQLNWKIKVAEMYPLVSIKEVVEELSGGNICLMPDLPVFRLLKVISTVQKNPVITTGPKDFVCVPVIGKPDLYDLLNSDGSNLGRAAIQTLSISQALQLKKATGEPLRVMAEWNEDFESYVVTSVM